MKLGKLIGRYIYGSIKLVVKTVLYLFGLLLPAFLVLVVLSQPSILLNRGTPLVRDADPSAVHEIIPETRWGNMRPCSEFWDEQKEFQTALQCVNKKVWSKNPLVASDSRVPLVPPRCFVVSAESPNVFSADDGSFNFIPIIGIFGIGEVVGVYQPESRTVFVVENIDAPQVYRHELQHYFLHLHDPDTQGGGHDQEVWKKCEPPYYTPSVKAKILGGIRYKRTHPDRTKDK